MVETHTEAVAIARDYACKKGVNEGRAQAYAEVWLDSGKDNDKLTPAALELHLAMKFNRV